MSENLGKFQPKDEGTIFDQLETSGQLIGEGLYSSDEELKRMLTMSAEELRDTYPFKYQAYIEALRTSRKQGNKGELEITDQLRELLTRVRAINNLERFVSDTARGATLGESEYQLREHQADVFDDLLCFFESCGDEELLDQNKRGWIKLPTGSGKTMIFSSLINATGLRSLILVPNLNLVEQTKQSINQIYPDLEVSAYFGSEKDTSGDVVISTYQSIHNLDQELSSSGTGFDLIICDEAHRALTDRISEHTLGSIGKGRIAIGFTATPEFNEGKRVSNHFGECIHEMEIGEAISADILSGVRCVFVETDIDLSAADIKGGDYNEVELEKALDVEKRNLAAIEIAKKEQFASKGIVAFCLSINHANKLAEKAKEQGVNAIAIHGQLDKKEQEDILSRYEAGEYDMLCTVNLLTEGWDSPRTEVGLMLRPTKSPVVAEQRAGRCLRKSKEKSFATIIDIIDKGDTDTGCNSITMVDILAGAVILPPAVREKLKNDPQFQTNAEDLVQLNIEGIRVIVNEEEIMQLLKENRPEEIARFENNEQILAILEEAEQNDLATIFSENIYRFTQHHFNTGSFIGSGAKLVRRYFREVKDEVIPSSITKMIVIRFFSELYGRKAVQEALTDTSRIELSAKTIKTILISTWGMTSDEISAMNFEVRDRRSRSRHSLTGQQIQTIVARQYGEEYTLAGDRAMDLLDKVTTKGEASAYKDNFDRFEEEKLILGDKKYLDLLAQHPLLFLLNMDDFRHAVFNFPNGKISGEMILEYNKVSTKETDSDRHPVDREADYREFITRTYEPTQAKAQETLIDQYCQDNYLPAMSFEQAFKHIHHIDTSFGRFDLTVGTILVYLGISSKETFQEWREANIEAQIIENSVARVRQHFSNAIKTEPFDRFMPLSDFMKESFQLEPEVKFSGIEVLRSTMGRANHKVYIELIDSILGEGYCREFWPLRQDLMVNIMKESMQYTAVSYGIFNVFLRENRWPDYGSFQQMTIAKQSDWIDRAGPYQINSGSDLLAYWVGTKENPKSTKPTKSGRPSKQDYNDFLEWLSEQAA